VPQNSVLEFLRLTGIEWGEKESVLNAQRGIRVSSSLNCRRKLEVPVPRRTEVINR